MTIKITTSEAEKEIKLVTQNFNDVVLETVKSVFFNEILRDAKLNASGRVLRKKKSGRRGGRGSLASSIRTKAFRRRGNVIGQIGVDLNKRPYARIHELGGIIKPKKGKWLTIPFKGIQGTAREFSNTFFVQKRGDRAFIFQNIGKNQIRPLFTLVKRVEMPKRPYLEPAIRKHIPLLERLLKQNLEDIRIGKIKKA